MCLELLYERMQIINGGKLCDLVGYGNCMRIVGMQMDVAELWDQKG